MTIACVDCGTEFSVSDGDIEFLQKISPTFCGTTFSVPPPKRCPRCRYIRRLTWRNEFVYYPRACDLCSVSIVSVHSPKKPYPVYCHRCWWSDSWDPLEFGVSFDSAIPFFEQFASLLAEVPQLAMINDNGVQSENCEYCQDFAFGKNCYLVTGSWRLQDSLYSSNCNHARDVLDCESVSMECELAYECIRSQNLYSCSFLETSANCSDCHFGIDLRGCSHCVACIGLRQKQYCIFNEQYSADEYTEKVRELNFRSFSAQQELQERFAKFALTFPRNAWHQVNCEDCNGDNLYYCKSFHGFDVCNGEYCKFYHKGDSPLYSYDIYQSGNAKWCYESVTPDDSYNTCFTTWCWKDKNTFYSDNCHSSADIFGCIGLRHKQYCLLNKQYSEADYEKLATEVLQQMKQDDSWGEFFPSSFSPFAYNETVAQEDFPLNEKLAVSKGYNWVSLPEVPASASESKVPDDIKECEKSICDSILKCSDCGKRYKVVELEFKFYQKMNLPLPRKCINCRRKRRRERAPMFIWSRKCEKCGDDIESSFHPSRQEIVYCESCYLESIPSTPSLAPTQVSRVNT